MTLRVGLPQAHQVRSGSDWRKNFGQVMPGGDVCCGRSEPVGEDSPTSSLGTGKMLLYPSEQILIAYADWRKPKHPLQTTNHATYSVNNLIPEFPLALVSIQCPQNGIGR